MFNNCSTCVYRTGTCGSRGPKDSPFVIVGESPGKTEIKEGKPFSGDSGKMLAKVVRECYTRAGIETKDMVEPFITNAISCFPQNKDLANMAKACKACNSRLVNEISAHPRKVILALGNGALWSLLGDYDAKITKVRGQVFDSPLADYGVVACVHPAFLLRGGGSFAKFKDDIELAIRLMANKRPNQYVPTTHEVLKTTKDLVAIRHDICKLASEQEAPVYLGSDFETEGFSSLDHAILCFGIGWKRPDNVNFIVPEELILTQEFKDLLNIPREYARYVWHNGKFDIRFSRSKGLDGRVDEDTMMLSYCLDENGGIHDLETVAANAIQAPNWKAMLDQYKSSKKASYREIPTPVLHKYAGYDIGSTIQSWYVLKPQVEKDRHLAKLYPFLIRMSNFLPDIENEGLLIDKSQVKDNFIRLKGIMAEKAAALNHIALARLGKTINPNAPQQVASLLYDGVRIPMYKGSRSTDADTLDMLPPNPVLRTLKEYRRAAKIYGTYVKSLYDFDKDPLGLPGKNTHSDMCVHPTFKLHGSVTGRLASSDPNVQNIPREDVIRSQFIAKLDRWLIEFDYNQAELRCLAELSRCDALMSIYLDESHPGLHHEMSVFLFGEGYTDEDKMRTKAVNFGIVYGRTAPSLAEEFKCAVAEAQRWIDGWYKRFPGASEFIKDCRNAPVDGRILITPFGRKRRFGVVSWENKQSVQNEAANFPHQSIASDCNLDAAEQAYRLYAPKFDARPCNLVHDSNLWSIPADPHIAYEFGTYVMKLMESIPPLYNLTAIKFKADAKIGTRWGHLRKVKAKEWLNSETGIAA